ncbi:hypothetical protein R1sor_017706 [Riccia sorocarpa]|uniref:Uncharacterized protein n=1 Tax=Riccia sorocarpa TaxID=122646 RepID=A0ABD3I9F8_9MARC
MWTCLPFSTEDDHEKAMSASRKKDDDVMVTKMYVAEAGDTAAAVEKMIRGHYAGVSIWFTYLVDYLGQSLVTYFHRVVEKGSQSFMSRPAGSYRRLGVSDLEIETGTVLEFDANTLGLVATP